MSENAQHVIEGSTPHELIVGFLDRECGITPEQYDATFVRVLEWSNAYPHRACVNTFSPIMLIEQVRREFDATVEFVLFAMIITDLRMGPRMMKLAAYDDPVWVLSLDGFPAVIAAAQERVRVGDEPGK